VRNFNELGRVKDALALARSLIANPRHPSNNTLDKSGTSASYGRTRLIETLTKWELWDELKAFTATPAGHPGHDITRLRAVGLTAYQQNDLPGITAALKAIEIITPPKPTEKSEKTDKSDSTDKTKRTLTKPGEAKKPDDKAKALSELKLLIALLTPKASKESKTKLLEALKDSDIPKDRLAHYWLKLDDKAKAAELTKNFPQDLAGTIAKAEILHAAGKADEAKKAFEEVKKLAFAMDRDLPVFQRLTTTFAKDANWPAEAPKRTDSGVRPADLSQFGPMHWHPPAAPVFEAIDLDAKPVKSSDFTSKKPTLFMFYLGHECGHCVEQMQAFAKTAADFEKAGIQLVGVTIEPSPVAKNIRSKLNLKKDAPLPFPILCDSSLEAFKKVRAYDDFEKDTLHATILVDTAGNQRWQDISYTPFTDAKFILGEAKRLLELK
jgi:peroxiredoxin